MHKAIENELVIRPLLADMQAVVVFGTYILLGIGILMFPQEVGSLAIELVDQGWCDATLFAELHQVYELAKAQERVHFTVDHVRRDHELLNEPPDQRVHAQ